MSQTKTASYKIKKKKKENGSIPNALAQFKMTDNIVSLLFEHFSCGPKI
jgi:hypothetical protein